MKKVFFIFCLFFFVACSKESGNSLSNPLPTPPQKITATPQFIKDGKGGLFNNLDWYTYDMRTHLIWSHFDVYLIKSSDRLFKLQILNYHNPTNPAQGGFYRLRLQEANSDSIQEIELDASACGNAYTNPDYPTCITDPSRNTFTYLDLQTLETWTMPEDEALNDSKWTIGFKGTKIILNSGTSGVGEVAGGLLYRDPSLFLPSGKGDIAQLQAKVRAGGFALDSFQAVSPPEHPSFYPPAGVDRVISESHWYEESAGGARSALPQNWWVVRSKEEGSFAKLQVSEIRYDLDDSAQVEIDFSYFVQAQGQSEFSSEKRVFTLEFDKNTEEVNLCLDFDSGLRVSCQAQSGTWDLRFVSLFQDGVSAWRIFTNNGAIGPMDEAKAEQISAWPVP